MAEKNVTGAVPSFRSFSDERVCLVRPDDARCAVVWGEDAGVFEQSEDSPLLLVVGLLAGDAALQRLAARFPAFTLDELRAFRAGSEPLPLVRLPH